MNNEMIGNLPKNINKVVPTPNSNAKEICKILTQNGTIVGYELTDGHQLSKADAVNMAKNGEIAGVGVAVSRKGEEYLRSLPDATESNNLSKLPQISI